VVEREIENILSHEGIAERDREILRRFDRDLRLGDRRPKTRVSYLIALKRLCLWSPRGLEEITKEDLKDFFDHLSRELKPGSLSSYKASIKFFYKWLHTGRLDSRRYPELVDWIKTTRRKRLPIEKERDLLTPGEVASMVRSADHPRDKALLMTLYEGALRAGEALSLRVGSVRFDQYGGSIMVDGKTGQRRIRLVDAIPYLRDWLNSHPLKDDPEAPLWIVTRGATLHEPLKIRSLNEIVRKYARRSGLRKRVHPHLFRHSRLTFLAGKLREQTLKYYAGWTPDSRMASVYVHLSGRDLDPEILALHGIETGEEEAPEERPRDLSPRECPRCGSSNPFDAAYCSRCGMILDQRRAQERTLLEEESAVALKREVAALREELLELRRLLVKAEGTKA